MLSTEQEAATIWFKDIEWEIVVPEEVNEGVIYKSTTTLNGSSVFINDERYSIHRTWKSQKDFARFLSWLEVSPNKTYKISFDIIGITPSEGTQCIYTLTPDGTISNNSPVDITDNWQRVTGEIKSEDYHALQIGLLFEEQYEGIVYITNIFVYDALDSPELPGLPTVDISRIPLDISIAVPVAVGANQQITTIFYPETASKEFLTWNSLNEDIATVDENGIVTGISKGYTAIYAVLSTTIHGSQIYIDVYEPESVPVAVSSITIDPMVIDKAVVGDKIQLEATVLPENADDKTVTWSSSNENAATVDADGLVTITAPGTAVITATANDGSGVKGVCLISGLSGLDNVTYTSAADKKDVYSVDGKLIMRSATRDDLNRLSPGIYLIGDQKIAIR